MKRILSLLLVFVMMLSVVPANVFAEDAEEIVFSDIEGEEYYAEAVLALVKAGIVNGYSDKTFRPEDKITRAEMATIVCRLIEKEDEADEAFGKTAYDDVEADHWASGYINVASAEGIIGGDGDGKFRPEDPVLHEEAIKMIVCTFGYGEDIESEGENWADPYLEVAEEKGISEALKGEKGDEAVRGEVALMADNGMKSVEADEEETPAEEVIVNENAPKAPVASRGTGTYDRTQYVDLETETKGATIYYTLDGTDPVEEGEVYVRTLRIYENLTLKAVAEKDGVYSEVITEEYEFTKKIFISSSSKTTIRSAKLESAGAAVTVANVGDVLTLVTDPVSATGTVTWTVGGVDKGITDKTYTVTSLDMGKTIKAQIVGTDSYEGTASAACSVATSVQVTAQDIMSDNADSSPVVLPDAEQTVFLDDAGDPVTVGADATITLSIENTEKTPEEVSEATTIVVQEIINNAVEGVTEEDLSDVTTVAVDVNLTVDETAVHPVGDVTVTLSAAQLGLPEDADLANYTFSAAHTNKNNEDEVVEGTVVTVDNVQYVRFELNGLSTIWIGNIPPRTVSFYNNEADADNKENSIGSVIVKFGDLTPTLKIPTPSNPGYLFCGWNYDMTRTPIITNLEVHALWVEGEKMPVNNIAVMLDKDTGEALPTIDDGIVNLGFDEQADIPANVVMTVEVTAPENAVKYYVGSDAAVVAAFNDAEGFIEIDTETAITFDVDVTDESGIAIPVSIAYYYKWIDADGNVISVQEIAVKIANGSEFANSKVYTADVNRGIGTFEAYLIDNDNSEKDYVAYINNGLNGDAVEGYTLYNYVSFDGYKIDYDYSSYDIVKLVFTPFEGESYSENDTIAAKGEYYNGDVWNENWNGSYEIKDGKLIVTYPFNTAEMLEEYADVIISVNDVTQVVEINWDSGGYSQEEQEDIYCETWADVLNALNGVSSDKQYYIYCDDTAAVTITNSLTIPANVDVILDGAPSFTVANGATLTMVDDRDHSCAARFEVEKGDFVVADGGKVTAAFIGENHGNRYYTSIRAVNITFKSGSSLVIPEDTLVSMYPTYNNEAEKGAITFESGSLVDNRGNLNVRNFDIVNLNGNFASTRYSYFYNDEININGNVNVNANGYGYLELYGTVNIGENGSIVVNNTSTRQYTNLEIYGPLNNKGNIEIKGVKTNAEITNNGFVIYNEGTVSVAEGCTITTVGTKIINTGVISGEGAINAYLGDDYTNYDDGTEYVDVESDGYWNENLNKFVYNLMEYSRYKYTHDPADTVDAILYLGEVINMGQGECTLTVNEEAFPEVDA